MHAKHLATQQAWLLPPTTPARRPPTTPAAPPLGACSTPRETHRGAQRSPQQAWLFSSYDTRHALLRRPLRPLSARAQHLARHAEARARARPATLMISSYGAHERLPRQALPHPTRRPPTPATPPYGALNARRTPRADARQAPPRDACDSLLRRSPALAPTGPVTFSYDTRLARPTRLTPYPPTTPPTPSHDARKAPCAPRAFAR